MVIYIMPMFRQAPLYLFLCHARALGDANQLQPTPVPWNLPVLQLILAKHPILLLEAWAAIRNGHAADFISTASIFRYFQNPSQTRSDSAESQWVSYMPCPALCSMNVAFLKVLQFCTCQHEDLQLATCNMQL